MILKLSAMAAGAILLTLLSACSAQQAAGLSNAGQVASAQSGQKCEVDVKRVCQELRDKPVISSATGLMEDATSREQNSARTASEFLSVPIPNGSVVEVSCEINAEHSTVVYAHLMPGPPLTATDIAFLQNAGYCAH